MRGDGRWRRGVWLAVALMLLQGRCVGVSGAVARAGDTSYVVCASRRTLADEAWRQVVDALRRKHAEAPLVTYDTRVSEVLPELRAHVPRYTCFVTPPEAISVEFVHDVHTLTRQLDDDPYADTFWGILTGYDVSNAMAIVRCGEPLTVRKVAAGTELALEMCEAGVCYDELVKNKVLRKAAGGEPMREVGPDDTTRALADTLTEYHADCFVTSGHATQRNWQIGYRYRNGAFVSKAGRMYGRDTGGETFEIRSSNPKVYMPVGNCLMGNIDGPDSMALAWMNSVGVRQMLGYMRPTWYGYMGWGCLDYFLEQPGRYTLTEAFFANNAALVHRLETLFPGGTPSDAAKAAGVGPNDVRGLTFDRDVVAFYGDPAWSATMAPGACRFDQSLKTDGNWYELRITPRQGATSFDPVSQNGSQRGGRPFLQYLPHRIGPADVREGRELHPVITDDFVLVPRPERCDPTRDYRVVFTAAPR